MSKRHIIGLVGAKSSGRTTAVQALQGILPQAHIVYLATKLNAVCAQVFNIPVDNFTHPQIKNCEMETLVYVNKAALMDILAAYQVDPTTIAQDFVRKHSGQILTTPDQIARYVGLEILRVLDNNLHCAAALEGAGDLIIIPDLAFSNELKYFGDLADCTFHSVHIQSTLAEQRAQNSRIPHEIHIKALGKLAQIVIHNNGTLEYFQELCSNFARGLKCAI